MSWLEIFESGGKIYLFNTCELSNYEVKFLVKECWNSHQHCTWVEMGVHYSLRHARPTIQHCWM